MNTVLFPGAALPVHVFEERYKQMIGRCIETSQPFGVCLIRAGAEVGGPAEPFAIGTVAHIREVQPLEDGRLNVQCVGGQRFRIGEITQRAPYLVAEVELLEPVRNDDASRDLAITATGLFLEYVRLNLAVVNQWARSIETPADAAALSDFIGARLGVDPQTKQRLLEEESLKLRLEVEIELLARGIRALAERVAAARAARWQGFSVLN